MRSVGDSAQSNTHDGEATRKTAPGIVCANDGGGDRWWLMMTVSDGGGE